MLLTVMMVAGYVFFLAPFYWLWNDLFAVAVPAGYGPVLIFQAATIVFMRWLVDNRFKEPLVSSLLHPLGFSFLFLAGLYAAARRVVGAGVHWKGRLYGRESGVQ